MLNYKKENKTVKLEFSEKGTPSIFFGQKVNLQPQEYVGKIINGISGKDYEVKNNKNLPIFIEKERIINDKFICRVKNRLNIPVDFGLKGAFLAHEDRQPDCGENHTGSVDFGVPYLTDFSC